jgi:hypothetical protein
MLTLSTASSLGTLAIGRSVTECGGCDFRKIGNAPWDRAAISAERGPDAGSYARGYL